MWSRVRIPSRASALVAQPGRAHKITFIAYLPNPVSSAVKSYFGKKFDSKSNLSGSIPQKPSGLTQTLYALSLTSKRQCRK